MGLGMKFTISSKHLGRPGRVAATAVMFGFAASLVLVSPADADNPLTNDKVAPEEQVDSTLGKFLAGRIATERGDLSASTRYYREALAEDPDSDQLRMRAYRAFIIAGQVADGVAIARTLGDVEEDGGLAQFVVTIDEIKAGDFDKARAALENVPAEGSLSLLRGIVAAWIETGAGNRNDALLALEPLSSTEGFRAFKLLHTAHINELLGANEDAETTFRDTVENRQTRSLAAIEGYASFLIRQGRRDEARAMFNKHIPESASSAGVVEARAVLDVADPAPPLIGSPAEGVALALLGTARAMAQNDSRSVAISYAYLGIYLRPKLDAAYTLIGNVREFDANWREANDAYGMIEPGSAYGWNARLRIATNLDRLEQTEDAMAVLREMADERPERIDAIVGLADMLRYDRRWEEAITEYDRAVERVGGLSPRNWSLLYSRGIALERARRWELAEADFLRALELRPDQPLVLNYLGYSWVEMGINLDRARSMIEKAVDLRPRDGYIIDSLGWVLYQLGEFDGAVRQLERAVTLRPTDSTINEHLGDAFWRVGRENEARFQWERSLQFDPDEEDIETIKEKIESGLSDI